MDHFTARKLVKLLASYGVEARWEDMGDGEARVLAASHSDEGGCIETELGSEEDARKYLEERDNG